MKNKKVLRTGIIVLFVLGIVGIAYPQGCVNADFSNNDFTGWTGRTGSCCPLNMSGTGIVNGRHTIMTGNGTDPNACDDITVVAPGYQYSARLGNPSVGAQGERLSYTYNVTAQSALFVYQYAVVLQDPGHSPSDQPRFEIRVLNSNGQLISQQCGYYQVTAAANVEGFRSCNNVRYRAWTPVGIDLSPYIGQNVTIEFTTGDCDLGGHYGYAYLVGECNPLEIAVDYCPSNSDVAVLTAPAGFSYLWNTGETTRTISISDPPNGSVYSCTLTAVTGCQVTVNATITSTAVNADFSYPPICPGQPIQFTDESTSNIGQIVQWDWNFGDGGTDNVSSPVHTFNNSGLYNVSLTATTESGCLNTYTTTVDVNPYPQASFTAPPVCDGDAANLINTTLFPPTIGSWVWDFGDSTALNTTQWDGSHVYPGPGTYSATLITISQNGVCMDTATGDVIVGPAPVADFTANDVCFGNPVYFTNNSTGNIVNCSWDFGDNTPPNYQCEPNHDYISPGIYEVTLTAINQTGCIDSIADTVVVSGNPHSEFDFEHVCVGNPVQFTNTSSMIGNNITNFEWSFGDGSGPNTTDWEPVHDYGNNPGTYTVTLITRSPDGLCTDTMVDSVRVYPSPVVDFTTNEVCLGQSMDFVDLSTGEINAWEWNFGDNTSPNFNPTVSHTYDAADIYQAQLVITTIYGCSDSVAKPVVVHEAPSASFTVDEVCEGEPTTFNSTSTVGASTSIIRYSWNYADLTPQEDGTTVTHTYAYPGNYNVTHYVVSAEGCVDSIIETAVVNPKPVVDFAGEPRDGCSPVCTDFRDLSGIMSGFNNQWDWLFGDGSTASDQNPIHCYKNESTDSLASNDVTLTVVSDKGCVSSVRKDNYVSVYPVPDAGFDYSPKVTDLVFPSVNFYDESVGATQWLWDFGDLQTNHTSIEANPVYTYLDTGTFFITQLVYNDFACNDTSDAVVVVNPTVTMYIPSAFTPDDNDVNDLFMVSGVGIVDFDIRIFDRWGELMYYSEDIKQGWNGKKRGGEKLLKQDFYVYTITITDLLGESHSYNGKVMLLR